MVCDELPCDFSKCMITKADELASQIEGREIPPSDDILEGSYPETLAQIRHEYTNYDTMLREWSALCMEYIRDGGECPYEDACPYCEKAYLTLASAARDEARALYAQWWEGHKHREKERRRDVAKRLTPEEIHYMDAGSFTMGNDRLRNVISTVLTKAPIDVVENLMDSCVMLMPWIEDAKGVFLPKELLADKDVILLPEALLDLEWSEIEFVILHEAAHYTLGHESPVTNPALDYDAQEHEADALVEQWLRDTNKD